MNSIIELFTLKSGWLALIIIITVRLYNFVIAKVRKHFTSGRPIASFLQIIFCASENYSFKNVFFHLLVHQHSLWTFFVFLTRFFTTARIFLYTKLIRYFNEYRHTHFFFFIYCIMLKFIFWLFIFVFFLQRFKAPRIWCITSGVRNYAASTTHTASYSHKIVLCSVYERLNVKIKKGKKRKNASYNKKDSIPNVLRRLT